MLENETEFYLTKYLSKRDRKRFKQLDTTHYFVCTCDRQGGSFGMDRVYNTKEWVYQAMEWEYMDDELDNRDKRYTHWLLASENPIDDIDAFWDITIEEYNVSA